MSEGTTIGWTMRPGMVEATLNPIRARLKDNPRKIGWYCEKHSPGCTGCYAEAINRRLGTGLPFNPGTRDLIDLYLDEDVLTRPLRWRKPHTIFWVSMSDAFARFVPKAWTDSQLAVAALTPWHHHIFLTKREEGCAGYFTDAEMSFRVEKEMNRLAPAHWCARELPDIGGFPLRNLFVGFSAERQKEFDERWAAMKTVAERGWRILVSLEPMLGPIHLPGDFLTLKDNGWAIPGGASRQRGYHPPHCSPDWVWRIVKAGADAGLPVFVKQMGSAWAELYNRTREKDAPESDRAGTNSECWPERIRVQQFPPAGTLDAAECTGAAA